MNYDITEVYGWCAGAKVSLTDNDIKMNNPNWEEMASEVVDQIEASVVMISVNVDETRVIKWCKTNKFKKGPIVRNWGHSGRKTFIFFKQINKSIYTANGGTNWDN